MGISRKWKDATTCPACDSATRTLGRLGTTSIMASGAHYAMSGWLCLHGWHDYPYLKRRRDGHYGVRRTTGGPQCTTTR